MDIDFYSQYININFDEILIESNNHLINSQNVYLKYKQQYFDVSLKNYELFKKYKEELERLQKSETVTVPNKYIFVYKDTQVIEQIKQKLKNVVLSQEKLLNNFHHYITLLNTNPNMFEVKKQTHPTSEKKSFLSKLFVKN
jgi:hypothetical protein